MILGMIVACGGEDGKPGAAGADGAPGADGMDGRTALVNVVSGEAEDCEHGGVLVEYGVDADGDETLDASEVTGTRAVCNGEDAEDGENGEDGHDALASVSEEAPGENCEFGGQRLELGTDADDSGTLDEGEITSTSFVCNGADGEDGEDGEDGAPGATGADGQATLFSTTDEAPGDNCEAGGKRIDSGVDADDNGTLDPAEIDSTNYVCHGEDGADGHDALVAVTDEMAGENCATGGKRIDSGTDADDSGTLDPAEIEATSYVCHGANALVTVTDEAAGGNCSSGGQRIDSGTDDDHSGALEAAEIDATDYVCHGDDGHVSLIAVADEAPGANCTNGGKLVTSGVDDSGDNVLDAAEVDDTDYVCNGNAKNALVATTPEPAGANCAVGGIKLTFGQDDDGNSVLDAAEVDGTSYVCNIGNAAFVPAFTGQVGPAFPGWTQCEGYFDTAAGEEIPTAWGNDCVAASFTKVKLVCGASTASYRYIDMSKNPFRDGLTGYPETGLVTVSKDQAGNNFTIDNNTTYAASNHPHTGVSWWAGDDGCGENIPMLTVNNVCSWEAANCFGQNLSGDRFLWVYVQ